MAQRVIWSAADENDQDKILRLPIKSGLPFMNVFAYLSTMVWLKWIIDWANGND
jgi:hypothetical protein